MKRVTSVEAACVYEQITGLEPNQITTLSLNQFGYNLQVLIGYDYISLTFFLNHNLPKLRLVLNNASLLVLNNAED
jgi:hypothetical protein